MRKTNWDRQLWGITMNEPGERPMHILGTGWHAAVGENFYHGEPTRALLFTTRKAARLWCADQHAKYAGRTDCCAKWRFRTVRVRERIVAMRDGK